MMLVMEVISKMFSKIKIMQSLIPTAQGRQKTPIDRVVGNDMLVNAMFDDDLSDFDAVWVEKIFAQCVSRRSV